MRTQIRHIGSKFNIKFYVLKRSLLQPINFTVRKWHARDAVFKFLTCGCDNLNHAALGGE